MIHEDNGGEVKYSQILSNTGPHSRDRAKFPYQRGIRIGGVTIMMT